MAFRPCVSQAFLEDRLVLNSAAVGVSPPIQAIATHAAMIGAAAIPAAVVSPSTASSAVSSAVSSANQAPVAASPSQSSLAEFPQVLPTAFDNSDNSLQNSTGIFEDLYGVPATITINLPTGPLPGIAGMPNSALGYWGYTDGFDNGFYDFVSETESDPDYFNSLNPGFSMLKDSFTSGFSFPQITQPTQAPGTGTGTGGLGMGIGGLGGLSMGIGSSGDGHLRFGGTGKGGTGLGGKVSGGFDSGDSGSDELGRGGPGSPAKGRGGPGTGATGRGGPATPQPPAAAAPAPQPPAAAAPAPQPPARGGPATGTHGQRRSRHRTHGQRRQRCSPSRNRRPLTRSVPRQNATDDPQPRPLRAGDSCFRLPMIRLRAPIDRLLGCRTEAYHVQVVSSRQTALFSATVMNRGDRELQDD